VAVQVERDVAGTDHDPVARAIMRSPLSFVSVVIVAPQLAWPGRADVICRAKTFHWMVPRLSISARSAVNSASAI
jgi:hypothetical protein